ncbi:unnamed protein product [Amoebophrya sp. A25]|nr:unnamed protein product [Amoebophrya sp. A25]|eukprot:GSA25T00017845001.1
MLEKLKMLESAGMHARREHQNRIMQQGESTTTTKMLRPPGALDDAWLRQLVSSVQEESMHPSRIEQAALELVKTTSGVVGDHEVDLELEVLDDEEAHEMMAGASPSAPSRKATRSTSAGQQEAGTTTTLSQQTGVEESATTVRRARRNLRFLAKKDLSLRSVLSQTWRKLQRSLENELGIVSGETATSTPGQGYLSANFSRFNLLNKTSGLMMSSMQIQHGPFDHLLDVDESAIGGGGHRLDLLGAHRLQHHSAGNGIGMNEAVVELVTAPRQHIQVPYLKPDRLQLDEERLLSARLDLLSKSPAIRGEVTALRAAHTAGGSSGSTSKKPILIVESETTIEQGKNDHAEDMHSPSDAAAATSTSPRMNKSPRGGDGSPASAAQERGIYRSPRSPAKRPVPEEDQDDSRVSTSEQQQDGDESETFRQKHPLQRRYQEAIVAGEADLAVAYQKKIEKDLAAFVKKKRQNQRRT